MESLYGLLVVKNGYLIAEKYFNEGSLEQLSGRQSVTKSVTSALVGIALDRGDLSNVDQKMVDFFPEFLPMQDARKEQITIRHLLQMRAGYPREDEIPEYFNRMFDGTHKWLPHIQDFVLVDDPGTAWNYSNLTSHILGVILSRASGADLMLYAQEHLFEPIGADLNRWSPDADGYAMGCIEIYLTARDMAKFGLLYLDDGEYEGNQVIPADWVRDSLLSYTDVVYFTGGRSKGRYFGDLGYGYQWWSAKAGDHRFGYASGHGGQYIVLLDGLDMIIVTTADPLYYEHGGKAWSKEKAITELVGKFIKSLPSE